MSTPGKMTRFRIDELSGVDSPAQKGARAAIMKRGGSTPEEIAAAAALAKHDRSQHEGATAMLKEIAKSLGLPETATEAEVTAALTKNAADLAATQASVATLTKVAALSAPARAHYDALVKADKKKDAEDLLDMGADEADEAVKKLAKGDETVVIEGRSISKRAVGDDMFAILKAQAERITKSEADIKKANEATANAVFTKRAEQEFAHVAGTVEERVAVLKALDSADPAAKAAGEAVLKAAESVAKLAFEKLGHSNDGGSDASAIKKATDAFEGKVTEIMKRDSTTRHDAMSKAAVEFPDELAAFQEASSQAA